MKTEKKHKQRSKCDECLKAVKTEQIGTFYLCKKCKKDLDGIIDLVI